MGYKLAGFDVIGCNEIDPKMMEAYKTNHNPKFAFLEPIQTFKLRKDLPAELYNLDILDGSPPCSSFSMAGNREKDWSKEKKFREGQAQQVLDTLFFDFIDLAKELQPKIVVAENVKGLIQGEAKSYVRKIYKAFQEAGYQLRIAPYLLDASTMGVPQRRERVFFIALRNDLAGPFMEQIDMFQTAPKLDMEFNEDEIAAGEFLESGADRKPLSPSVQRLYNKRLPTEFCLGETAERLGKRSHFNEMVTDPTRPGFTLRTQRPIYDNGLLTDSEIAYLGSYPIDYNHGINQSQYLIGMSVPPVMVAQIATRILEQWLKPINET